MAIKNISHSGARSTNPVESRPASAGVHSPQGNLSTQERAQLRADLEGASTSGIREQIADRSLERGMTGRGRGRPLDPATVSAAERRDVALRDQPIPWDRGRRAEVLNNLTQIDSDQSTTVDANRCGASAITAGVMLRGEEGARDSARRMGDQAGTVADRFNDDDPRRQTALDAQRTFRELQDPSHRWTYGDAHRFQEATHQITRLEHQARHAGEPDNGGLDSDVVRSYRDIAWGDSHPTYPVRNQDGTTSEREVDIYLRGDSHFILGEGRTGQREQGAQVRELYNPWPEADGTAYSQGVDGGDLLDQNLRTGEPAGHDQVGDVDREDRLSPYDTRVMPSRDALARQREAALSASEARRTDRMPGRPMDTSRLETIPLGRPFQALDR